MIVLTGGELGGESIEWMPEGVLDDGREYMVINGMVYARSGDCAVYAG